MLSEESITDIKAKHWQSPIKNVCLKLISSYLISDFDFLSAIYKIIPIAINAIAIIIGVSNLLPTNLSNIKPIIPPGIVAITRYQNIFPSKLFSFFTACLYPPFISSNQSLKKNITIAKSVPKCRATSNPSKFMLNNSELVHPNIHGIIVRCAELDIGSNSVNPCIAPKIIACNTVIFQSPFLYCISVNIL